MPSDRGSASAESARRRASFTVAAFSAGLRRPIERRAQLTPFLTKFLPSPAALLAERQKRQERVVAGFLVVEGEAGLQHEARPFLELVALAAPRRGFLPGVRGAVEEHEADGIDDAPVVEVAAPAVHLRRRDEGRVVDVGGDGAGLVPARLPESQGQLVIAPEPFRHLLHGGHRHAPGFLRPDAVALVQVPADARLTQALERGERRADLSGERGPSFASSESFAAAFMLFFAAH